MSTQIAYYIFCIIAFIVGFMILKKLAGCLVKTVIFLVLAAILAYIYYQYFYCA